MYSGQSDIEEQYINGQFGAGLGVFCDERAASRIYHYIPKVAKHVINYVAFSPLDKLPFDPDVLLVLAKTSQAEVLLRAMSYKTGQMWSSRYSAAIGCAMAADLSVPEGRNEFYPHGPWIWDETKETLSGRFHFCIHSF